MEKSLAILNSAQQALNKLDFERAKEGGRPFHTNDWRSVLLVANGGNGLHVQYDGEVWEGAFEILLDAIARAASDIVSLKFVGDDAGANGLRAHDFAPLLATDAVFPNLKQLLIRPSDVGSHCLCQVEENQLPELVARCSNLESLTLPQAPEAAFFNCSLLRLRELRIGMGWELYQFIANFARASKKGSQFLPALQSFDFTDSLSVFDDGIAGEPPGPVSFSDSSDFFKSLGYDQAQLTQMQSDVNAAHEQRQKESRFDNSFTSFEDYCALFSGHALNEGAMVRLRNTYLTEDNFFHLHKLRSDLQLSVSLEAPHVYVNHWQGQFSKPFRHLILNRSN
jgi:hypothetical protein